MKKPKCKPASTLKSVSGLGLSKRAERYVEKNYFSMDQLVWHVRFLYYMMQYHPETLKAYRPKVFHGNHQRFEYCRLYSYRFCRRFFRF